MKAFSLAAALAASTVLAMPAAAQGLLNPQTYLNDTYVQLNGGAAFEGRTKAFASGNGLGSGALSESQNYDAFGSVLIGHSIAPGFAFELEGVYQRDNLHTGKLDRLVGFDVGGAAERNYGGLANVKFSIPYTLRYRRFGVTPYVAAGAGYGSVRYTTGTGFNANQDGFIYQGKAGIEVKTGTPISLDFGYRYLAAPEYSLSGSLNGIPYTGLINSHVQVATAGIRYTF